MLNTVLNTFSTAELICLAVVFFSLLIQLYYYLRFYTAIFRNKRRIKKGKIKLLETLPEVSVIICARNEEENLKKHLPSVLKQDYPNNYEVIVINDRSYDESETVLELFKKDYPHLKTSFVPHDAKYIDSKKIAVILGVKAAKNDILVFTDADCEPISNKWLENMVRSFSEGKQIVLGYGAYNKNKSFTNMLQVFDTLFIGIQYLNYAIAGYPYMGVGRNMAYRKSFFEKSKGFSKHLDIQSGDDDLFVNDFAKGKNTAVCVSPESVTTSEEKKKFSAFLAQKERHLSTSGRYKFSSKLLLGAELGSRFLFYLGIVLTGACQIPYWYFIAPGAFLLRYIVQYIIINLNAKALGERKFYFGIGLMDILLPLINLYLYIVAYFRPKAHYKWK